MINVLLLHFGSSIYHREYANAGTFCVCVCGRWGLVGGSFHHRQNGKNFAHRLPRVKKVYMHSNEGVRGRGKRDRLPMRQSRKNSS